MQTLEFPDAAALAFPPEAVDAMWIFGPTASGKSALALSIAAMRDAVIINADASQLYAPLRVLSARPSAAEEAQAPHRLYGVLGAQEASSVARWLALVAPAVAEVRAAGKLPLLVGGTGMYLAAALEGISPMPDIPPMLRARLQQELAADGLPAMYAQLQALDPTLAVRLKPGDTQRILRALEVVRHTGTPLSVWQQAPKEHALPPLRWHGIRLLPEVPWLNARIAARVQTMWHGGALEEVAALEQAHVPDDAPVRKAIGVTECAAYLRGDIDAATAQERLLIATRQYAKRQRTWARGML